MPAFKTIKPGIVGLAVFCLSLSVLKAEPVYKMREAAPTKEEPRAPIFSEPVDPHMFKRFLLVDLGAQRVDLYEEGVVTYTTPASSGREDKPTPKGVFVITDKHEKWTSTIYNVPMPNFMRLNGGDVGLHAGILPGYPGSAGCIRLPETSATYLFQHVPEGTRVVIQGQAPNIEWIRVQYRSKAPRNSISSSRNAKTSSGWKPPYPIIHTSWSNPAKADEEAKKADTPQRESR